MHLFLIKYGICPFQGDIVRCFSRLFGDAGLIWAPFGATCSSRGFYLQQYSILCCIYAVFAWFSRGWPGWLGV